MAIQPSDIKDIVSLLSSVLQLGQIWYENWYKASEAFKEFKSNAEQLEKEFERWYERARVFGLLSDTTLSDSITHAKKQLEQEKVRLEGLERGCGRFCLCWLSSGTYFPTQLGKSIVNLNDRIPGNWKSDRDVDKEALEQAKLLAKAPRFGFIEDRRYVRHRKIEEKLRSLLNEEATRENASRFVLLHGRSGSGKSSMARHLALEYKKVADGAGESQVEGTSASQEKCLDSNCAERCSYRKFDNVLYLECGPDVDPEKKQVELLRMLHWKLFSGTGETLDSKSEVGKASNSGKTTAQDLEEIKANPVPILRQLLQDSHSLIIIDDVFEGKILQNVKKVCGKQTKILVTSQDSRFGEWLTGEVETVQMDPMEPEDSVRIIKLHTGFQYADEISPRVQERMDDLAEKGHGHPHSLVSLSAGIIQKYRTDVGLWDAMIWDYKKRLDKSLSKAKDPLQGVPYNSSVTEAIEIKISRLGEEAKKLLVLIVMINSPWRSENLLWLFYVEMIAKGIPEDGNSYYKFLLVKEELEDSNCIQIREDVDEELDWFMRIQIRGDGDEELAWFMHALDEEFIQTKMMNNVNQIRKEVEDLPHKQQGLETKSQVHISKILAASVFKDVFKDAKRLGEYNLNNSYRSFDSLICLLARSVMMSQRSVHENRGETSQQAHHEHPSQTCQKSSYQVLLSLAIDEEIHNNAILNLLQSPLSKQVWNVIRNFGFEDTPRNINQEVIVSILRIYGTFELVGNNPQYVILNYEQIKVLRHLFDVNQYQVTSLVFQMRELVLGLFKYPLPYSLRFEKSPLLEKELSSNLLRDFVRHDGLFTNRMMDYGDEVLEVTSLLKELRIKCEGQFGNSAIDIMVSSLEILIGLGQYQHAVNILETLRQDYPEECKLMDEELLLHARIQLEDWDGLLHDLDLGFIGSSRSYSRGFEKMGLMMRLKGDFDWEGLNEAVQLRVKAELARNRELKNLNEVLQLSERLLLERGFLKFLHGDIFGATADLDYLTKAEEDRSHDTNHDSSFYTRRGVIRRHMGAFVEALKDFQKAVQLGGSYKPYVQLVYVKFLMGDEVGARADLDAKTDAPSPFTYQEGGLFYEERGFFYQERGTVKRLMGDHSGALEDLNEAFLLSTKDYETLKQRGYVRFLLRDHDGAQSDAEKALRYRPDTVNMPGFEYDCLGTSIVEFLGYRL